MSAALSQNGRPGLTELLARIAGQSSDAVPPDLIELGRVGEPYGVKGWINVQPYSGDNSALKHAKSWFLSPPASGFGAGTGTPIPVKIAACRMHSGRLVAQLQGIDDRTDAEKLKGLPVWVSRAAFPPLKKGEFYWVDLIGLSVINREGVLLGTVSEVTDHGAHPILCVTPAEVAADHVDAGKAATDKAGSKQADANKADANKADANKADANKADANQADAEKVDAEKADPADPEERLIPFVPAYIDGVDLATRTVSVDWQADY